MIESLPTEVTDVFRNFVTTEYVTVDAQGQPIAWPVTPYMGESTLDVTTGIGYPKKADDAARHPSIAMLYSDPTGSGMESPPQVLVQGTAQVDEADLGANRERYRRESAVKLPAAQAKMPPKFVEGLLAWYFDRIYVKLTPRRVIVWPGGDATKPPEVFGDPLPEATVAVAAADEAGAAGGVWDERIDELGSRYSSAVLAWTGAQGFPFAARVAGQRRRRGAPHRLRSGAGGDSRSGRPRLRHRAPPRPGVQLAGEFPGARRGGPGGGRPGARAAQDGGWLRAARRGPAGGDAAQLQEGTALSPDFQGAARGARLLIAAPPIA